MRHIYIIIFLLINYGLNAQIGGTRTYMFLDLPVSARNVALGGLNPAVTDENSPIYNPAHLTDTTKNRLSASYVNYFADIKWGYSAYTFSVPKLGNFITGMQYINYGKMIAADETGEITGTFSAADYDLNIGWQYSFDSAFSGGIMIKPVFSQYENYTSIGLASDWVLNYSKNKYFTATILLRNAGFQIKPYTTGNREKLPFDIRAGVYQRLPHSPFAFTIVAHHLNVPDLSYTLPTSQANNLLNNSKPSFVSRVSDLAMRHLIFGAEIIPSKHFYISFGYNYQRRQELKISTKTGLTGFSAGLGIKIKRFTFNYGISRYHLAGNLHIFTFSFDLQNIYKKL